MKKNSIYVFTFAAIVSLLASCATDNNNTTSDSRDKFVGSWTCRDTSFTNNDKSVYSVSISKVGDGNTVQINNFYNLGSGTFSTAEVSDNSIVIPSQIVDVDYTINGSGIFSNDKFSISYSAKLGNSTDNGEAAYSQ